MATVAVFKSYIAILNLRISCSFASGLPLEHPAIHTTPNHVDYIQALSCNLSRRYKVQTFAIVIIVAWESINVFIIVAM